MSAQSLQWFHHMNLTISYQFLLYDWYYVMCWPAWRSSTNGQIQTNTIQNLTIVTRDCQCQGFAYVKGALHRQRDWRAWLDANLRQIELWKFDQDVNAKMARRSPLPLLPTMWIIRLPLFCLMEAGWELRLNTDLLSIPHCFPSNPQRIKFNHVLCAKEPTVRHAGALVCLWLQCHWISLSMWAVIMFEYVQEDYCWCIGYLYERCRCVESEQWLFSGCNHLFNYCAVGEQWQRSEK